MTEYAGETVEVFSSGIALDGKTPLTPSNITSVKLHIRDAAGDLVVDNENMVWAADEELWLFKWATATLDPGRYVGRVAYRGVDDSISFEFLSMKLSRPKFEVT